MEAVIIIGLGNILYGDEGYGVRLAQNLYARWDFPDHVEVVDGGTQGQTLLTYVERADRLLVLDADQVRPEMAQKAKELLTNAQGRILGAILNRVEVEQEHSYYYYYYGHKNKDEKKER